MNDKMRRLYLLICITLLVLAPAFCLAASFHWVDRGGFHTVDQVTKVPLERRLDLPMVHNRTALPFTADEDKDGAMYVWFVLNRSGIHTPYITAARIPDSLIFTRVDLPKTGDIAWWKGFVAIMDISGQRLLTAAGNQTRAAMERKRGKAVWYRYSGPLPTSQPQATPAKAPQKALRSADNWLARLDKTAEYPLQVKDHGEVEQLKAIWQQAIQELEQLRSNYPEDPQIIRRLGVLYRRGFTLEMPGAWARAEAYLLKAAALAPNAADAFISLGILYGDSGEGFEKQAEMQFRSALKLANRKQRPHILWGLSVALMKQGKKAEALKTVDRLLRLNPKDSKALKLKEEIVQR